MTAYYRTFDRCIVINISHTRKYEAALNPCTTMLKGELSLFILLAIPSATHSPRNPFQLIERVRADGPIVSIPSWMVVITVNVYFPGQTIWGS